jgi:hypothetical protein
MDMMLMAAMKITIANTRVQKSFNNWPFWEINENLGRLLGLEHNWFHLEGVGDWEV